MECGKLFALQKNGRKLEYVESVPARIAILAKVHGDFGHIRREEMMLRIAEKYYWKSVREDVEFYIDNCADCQERGKGLLKVRDTLKQVKIPSKAWYIVGMDLVELPVTPRGNRYVLVLIDHFTKWIELIPMPDKEALTVAFALFDIYCRVGAPHRIVTGNGKEFANQVNKELHRLVKTKHHFIRPYTPRENGMTERQNRSLKDALKIECGKLKDLWDLCLQKAAFSLRNRTHRATGFSPHELFYSFHLRKEPGEKNTAEEEEFVKMMELDDEALDEYVNRECTRMNDQLAEVAELLREETAANLAKEQARQKKSFEMRQMGRGELLEKGQLVMFRDRDETKKLWGKKVKQFKGPGTVTKVFASKAQIRYGKVNYTVENGDIRVQKHQARSGPSLAEKLTIRTVAKRKRSSASDEEKTAADETGIEEEQAELSGATKPGSSFKVHGTRSCSPAKAARASARCDSGCDDDGNAGLKTAEKEGDPKLWWDDGAEAVGIFEETKSSALLPQIENAPESSEKQTSPAVKEQNRAQSEQSDVTVEYNRYECLFPKADQNATSKETADENGSTNTAYPVPTPEWLESLQGSFSSTGDTTNAVDAAWEQTSNALLFDNPRATPESSLLPTASLQQSIKKTAARRTEHWLPGTRSILTRSMSDKTAYEKAMHAKWIEVKSKTARLHDSSVVLQEKDRLAILDIKVNLPKEVQGWVSDQVIHGSNVLLQDKYPGIGGLSAPTSYEVKPKRKSLFWKNVRVVQCILMKGSHWIVVDSHNAVQDVAGKFVVNVLDSTGRNTPLLDSRELMHKVAVLVNTLESVILLRFRQSPQQANGKDCGILVVAVMYAACAGKSMRTLTFAESKGYEQVLNRRARILFWFSVREHRRPVIRRHLLRCLTTGEITDFPPGTPLLFASEIPEGWHTREYRVACECRLPTAGRKVITCRMKSCAVKTFHLDCVRPVEENFVCGRCVTADQDKHPDRKRIGSPITLEPE